MQPDNHADLSLRHTFDEAALLYNEIRPRYPDDLFSTLMEVTSLPAHAALLEIGPGTGQATMPLAQKGFAITAIELGDSLAQVARQQLHGYNNVQLITGAFEDIPLQPASFDLVFAATSFHWIKRAVKFPKPHQVLKDKGHLAIIHTNHVSDEMGDAFFNASQPVYDKYGFTDTHQKSQLPRSSALRPSDLDEQLFKLVHFQLFPVRITYTASQFVKLLSTFSNHLAAPKAIQQKFYAGIEALINHSFQGKIDKYYSMSLTVAEKKQHGWKTEVL